MDDCIVFSVPACIVDGETPPADAYKCDISAIMMSCLKVLWRSMAVSPVCLSEWLQETLLAAPKYNTTTMEYGCVQNISMQLSPKMWISTEAWFISCRLIQKCEPKLLYIHLGNYKSCGLFILMFRSDSWLKKRKTAKITKSWLYNLDFTALDWSENSPDMNPVQNLWATLLPKAI